MSIYLKFVVSFLVVFLIFKVITSVIISPIVTLHNVLMEYQVEYNSITKEINETDNLDEKTLLMIKRNNIRDKYNVILSLYPNNFINLFLKYEKLI